MVFMGLFFRVNDSLKEKAQQSGAVWMEDSKAWYFDNPEDYFKHKELLLNGHEECIVAHDRFYIMVAKQQCFKCGKETSVIAFGLDDFYSLYDADAYGPEAQDEHSVGFVFRVSRLEPLPRDVAEFLKCEFKFHRGYSKFRGSNYIGNHCDHCGVLQGDFFLYDEVGSPFFFDSEEKVGKVSLIEVPLEHDVIVRFDSIDCTGLLLEYFGAVVPFVEYVKRLE